MDINIMEFVTKEFVWLVPCLIVLGAIIKKIPSIPDWLIPFILLIISVIIAGFSNNFTKDSLLQGFICGLAATGTHQLVKQPIKENKEKKKAEN